MTRYTEAYANEIAAFIAVIKDNAAPVPNGNDGMVALALAEAAMLSIKEGRTVAVKEVG